MFKPLLIASLVAVLGVFIYIKFHIDSAEIPVLPDIQWKQDDQPDDEKIIPFKISVSNERIQNLREQLRNTTLVPPLREINFEYGFNTDHLKTIIDFWINDYKWNDRQDLLNSVPQFKTKVSGLNIHFVHLKPDVGRSKGKRILPLLLIHGWPGSVKEFYSVFSRLTRVRAEYDFVFEIIAPSLPGYAFSDATTSPGLDTAHVGLIMKKLMNRLGFEKFYVQGGDWGSFIGNHMATLFPDSVLGFHSNMCTAPLSVGGVLKLMLVDLWPQLVIENEIFRSKLFPLSKYVKYLLRESGYLHLQATKPDTIGVALMNSPAGLAAYILEKFSTWMNSENTHKSDGGLSLDLGKEKNYSIEDLLDNVMIYWVTNSITSAMRIYSEVFNNEESHLIKLDRIPITVPTACANYPQEFNYVPEFLIREKHRKLVHFSHLPKGGHFAAFEEPDLFSEDLWKAIQEMEGYARNNTSSS